MYEKEIENNVNIHDEERKFNDSSDPMRFQVNSSVSIANYRQEGIRPAYDYDSAEIISEANSVNNMIPQKLPVYNFNADEINGENYYKPDGNLLFIREYDSDVIRDYYVKQSDNTKIERILEHDKNSGRLRTKIESVTREGSLIKSNITLFDVKINKKYILIQLTQDGTVNNITEFLDNGKNFKTVYRGYESTQVVKYISGKDTKDFGFVMTDCIFDKEGKIARIKRFSNKKDIDINYNGNRKSVNIKNKS